MGDVFEGFLQHSIELAFRPERYDEAVVDGQDGCVPFDKRWLALSIFGVNTAPKWWLTFCLATMPSVWKQPVFVSKTCYGGGENSTRGEATEGFEMRVFCDFSRICYVWI